jgi:hypothetical protein
MATAIIRLINADYRQRSSSALLKHASSWCPPVQDPADDVQFPFNGATKPVPLPSLCRITLSLSV